jgi:rod shape-determining protein mreC
MYKDNKNGKIGIIVTVIVLICLVIITNLDNNILSKIVNPFTKITMSAQSGVAYLKNKLSKNNEYFVTQDELKSQNSELKKENDELKISKQELEVLKAENKTLKEYVKLTDQYSEYNTTPGYVIQRDFSNYSKVVVINIGKNNGIESGMTVVAEGGLVGYVVSVEDNSSKVQTIIDTASAVSAAFVNTEKSLVTRGILDSKDRVKGTYIDNDVVVNEGDSIVTSGIGGIYPKNINIGKVKEIVNTQNKTNRYVYIETAVDFDNLNNVLVIKK